MESDETQSKIKLLEDEIKQLSASLSAKKEELFKLRSFGSGGKYSLSNSDISRFSRQIILPEIGVKGQLKLKNASVLCVGAGGLGCPAALYLCGAGIGHIGIVDYDVVELNNLHRQIVHQEQSIGKPKATSIKDHIQTLNSTIRVTEYNDQFNSKNALSIINDFDVVLDATDNVASRYLLNDACVLAGKPLVSGSALQFEGQLTVYNYQGGPCYRCLFPKPPPPETVTNCGDGGIIGAVTGCIGSLQALEAIKIIIGMEKCLNGRLLLFDATSSVFRNIKLRGKSSGCEICANPRKICELIDYEEFCGMRASDKELKLTLLPESQRIPVHRLNEIRQQALPHILIDVRTTNEFEICHLEKSENYPIQIFSNPNSTHRQNLIERIKTEKIPEIYVICRRGNDSQVAAQRLIEDLKETNFKVNDVIGGLHAWTNFIDKEFPKY